MKAQMIAATVSLMLAGVSAFAGDIPAWQEQGFVMEEVVATAPASVDPAWLQPGYVMEEVIVTAPDMRLDRLHAAVRENLMTHPLVVASLLVTP